MKKKNALILALSLMLVLVIGIGTTLAYLTANAEAVVNTFTFANNITVDVGEEPPETTGDESISSNSTGGFDYDNLVPGQALNKKPTFTVTTDVKAYVFAKVEGASENVSVEKIPLTEGNWALLDGTDQGNGNGIYWMLVQGQEGPQNLAALFDKVTVGNVNLPENATEEERQLGNINILIAAVQAEGFADAAAAFAEATFKTVPNQP